MKHLNLHQKHSIMAAYRESPLRQQLSLAMTVGVLLVALLSSLASTWQGSRQIRQSMLEQGQRVAENFARQSTLALLSGSPENAAESAAATLAFPDVTRVEIHQANGSPLLVRGAPDHSKLNHVSSPYGTKQAQLESETGNDWRFVAPVIHKVEASPFDLDAVAKAQQLGFVRVVQSKTTLTRMVTNVLLINLAVSFSCAFVFLLVIRSLSNRLTLPLAALSTAMARAERGEDDAQAPVFGPKDVVDMANSYNRMITTLQDRELALRDSQARYREVIESVKEAIFQTDSLGRWILLNPAWTEITGFALDMSLQQPLLDFIFHGDRARVAELQRQLATGMLRTVEYEVRFIHRNGTEGWAEIKQHGRFDAKGVFIGTAGTFDDITERKHNEQELAAHRQHLEDQVQIRTAALQAVNKELEAFSYSVSHDLRAPLRAVDGFARMLQEDCGPTLPDEGKDYLNRIIAAATRMSQLTDGLLSLARVSRNELHRKPVDLSAMVGGLFDELQATFPERRVNITIEPELTANADQEMMLAVLQNLVSNAWKFTAKRELAHIEFGRTRTAHGTGFYLRDDGAGFDMAYAGKLFGAFQRLHGKEEFQGTGIGLATVQRIIHRHGGEIWAEASVDNGATFYFTLPDD